MSEDMAERLRVLAQDYHEGRIDLAAYRGLRAPLLDSLGRASDDLAATEPRTGSWKVQAGDFTRPGKLAPPSVPQKRLTPSRNRELLIAAAVGMVALGVVVWFLRNTSPAQETHATAPVEENGISTVINAFMSRADWSDARLASLNADLLERGSVQIARIAGETGFQQFVDELRRRLKEQQALASTTLTIDNSPLAALAVTVGLDLNAPDSAIHIAALPPPAPLERQPEQTPTVVQISSVKATTQRISLPVPKAQPVAAEQAQSRPSIPEDPCRIDLIRSRRPLCKDTLPAGGDAPMLALIPAGSFDMGSAASSDESPIHRVTIGKPFAISVYEISQGEYKQYCEQTQRACAQQPWSGDDFPVVNVSWDDARAYTDWLSSVTHHRYSLPTEAQWEYAARAGRNGLFPSGDTLSPTDAHFSMLTKQASAARRSQKFNANAFRLMHTVGNVREWVEDGWSPSYANVPLDGSAMKVAQATARVVRGGAYTDGTARLRLTMREPLPPGTRDVTTGFRIVRELP